MVCVSIHRGHSTRAKELTDLPKAGGLVDHSCATLGSDVSVRQHTEGTSVRVTGAKLRTCGVCLCVCVCVCVRVCV